MRELRSEKNDMIHQEGLVLGAKKGFYFFMRMDEWYEWCRCPSFSTVPPGLGFDPKLHIRCTTVVRAESASMILVWFSVILPVESRFWILFHELYPYFAQFRSTMRKNRRRISLFIRGKVCPFYYYFPRWEIQYFKELCKLLSVLTKQRRFSW